MEMILDLRLIPLYFFQSIMSGPKVLWLINHFSRCFEDLEKNHAANNIKGVVGIPGTKTPRNPNPTHINPRQISRYFLTN